MTAGRERDTCSRPRQCRTDYGHLPARAVRRSDKAEAGRRKPPLRLHLPVAPDAWTNPQLRAGRPAPGHHLSCSPAHPLCRLAPRSGHRRDGQQLPELLHADPDADRRELLRDHGGRRDDRDHLRRHRPVGRVDLRARRRHDRHGAARLRARRIRRGHHRRRNRGRRRPALRRRQRPDGRRARRAPLHHHARDDVGAARDRVREQQRGEHRAAAAR